MRAARGKRGLSCLGLLLVVTLGARAQVARGEEPASAASPDFSAEPRPLALETFPARPRPLLELGDPFLAPGPLREGFTLPTGATWSPSLLLFGYFRTAVQSFEGGSGRVSEWANRLDIFANLRLSGTERLVAALRPFDTLNNFSGYSFEPRASKGWVDALNNHPYALFFEGNFQEMFPRLVPYGKHWLDYDFSVGRQLFNLQDGMLLNDTMDMVAIGKQNLFLPPGASQFGVTAFFAWANVDRGEGTVKDPAAKVVGLHTRTDYGPSTVDLDGAYLTSAAERGDGAFAGLSATQRLGRFNTTLRGLMSLATRPETELIHNGGLVFGQVSISPPPTENLLYWNLFWGIEDYTSVAREPDVVGAVGNTGILFSEVGIGRYGAALHSSAADSVGSALGYQMYFQDRRSQLDLEVGGRESTAAVQTSAAAVGFSYQRALCRNLIARVDSFVGGDAHGRAIYGARTEMQVKF